MKQVIIDNRMLSIKKDMIRKLGYNIVELPCSDILYPEISSHPDIFCCKINDKVIIEEKMYERINEKIYDKSNIVISKQNLEKKYPYDVIYNICQIGKNVIHNFKYTNKEALNLIDKCNLNKINIKQGYSNCSIAVIDENSVIVSDEKVAEILSENKIDILNINWNLDIKLLNSKGTYSNMTGFIGGAISRLDDYVIVFGDLEKIDKNNIIRSYITKKGFKIIDFKGLDVIDYGGIIEI